MKKHVEVKTAGSQTEEGILKGKMSLSSTEVVHNLTVLKENKILLYEIE